jgi:hypothetical protein
MDPLQFQKVADYLVLARGEAFERSAVSRWYYGAYLYVRDALLPHFRREYLDHKWLPEALSNCRSASLQQIGHNLKTLRDDRRLADYDTRVSLPALIPAKAKLLSAGIVAAFDSQNLALLVSQMKRYFRDHHMADAVRRP